MFNVSFVLDIKIIYYVFELILFLFIVMLFKPEIKKSCSTVNTESTKNAVDSFCRRRGGINWKK